MGARRIVCTPDVCSGSPRVDGTRITVANIVAPLDPKRVELHQLTEYVPVDDAIAALRYCAEQRCLIDRPESFCEQCTLDKRAPDPPAFFLGDAGEAAGWSAAGHAEHADIRGRAEWLADQPEQRDLWNDARQCLRTLDLDDRAS
jgi:uncharacterized protein (DUF433 family)